MQYILKNKTSWRLEYIDLFFIHKAIIKIDIPNSKPIKDIRIVYLIVSLALSKAFWEFYFGAICGYL